MPSVEKTVLVMHTPEQMFHLVDDVLRYPEFLPWCGKTEVHERKDLDLTASLHIDYLGIRQKFTTKNKNTPHERIDMALVEGPFTHLHGVWQFTPLGDQGCKIQFNIDYSFNSKLLEKVIGTVFNRIMSTLTDAFIVEADRLYGE